MSCWSAVVLLSTFAAFALGRDMGNRQPRIPLNAKGRISRFSQAQVPLEPHFCHWPKPYSLSDITPTFRVRTRDDQMDFNISSNDQIPDMVTTMQQSGFIKDRVLFVIHGYENNINTPWLYQMSDALLSVEDDTVIVTGWGNGADFWVDYDQAASNTQTVSAVVALLSEKLREVSSTYLYCIGHSLGAHICGQAGNTFKFDRVSGLDPAGPGFQYCPKHPGLNDTSGACVDVLHTNGEEYDGFGRLDPLGHIDFYLNCGRTQPGCRHVEVACSHDKAIDYFIQTVHASATDPLQYPDGQGSCDDDFLDDCQPCTDDSCPSSQPTCGQALQPVGFRSPCSDTNIPDCGSVITGQQLGKWFVPVTKNGFDSFCPDP